MLSIAKKARIEWLQKGALVKKDEVHYVLLPFGMRISKANVIATVVEKQASGDGSLCRMVLDDGTDTIAASFSGETLGLCDGLEVGGMLTVIGEVREMEGERMILPDIVRPVENPNFELLRELELRAIEKECWEKKKALDELRKTVPDEQLGRAAATEGISPEMAGALVEYEEASRVQETAVEEKIFDLRQSVMQKIIELDAGGGVAYETVVSSMQGHGSAEVEKALGELLNSGDIYEPMAGIYRIL